MENDDEDHASRKLEKRCANFSVKIESYEDLEARMEHMESLVEGHFDEDPDHANHDKSRVYSSQQAADARELLRLKKKEEDEQRAKAIAAQPTPLKIMAHAAPESPIDDALGALATGDEDVEVPPDVPAEVAEYIPKLITIANEPKILKGASFKVEPNINAIILCQRMANEVHRDHCVADAWRQPCQGSGLRRGVGSTGTTSI